MKTLENQNALLEIISRINNLKDGSKSEWGKMTINEMLCHCADQLRLAAGLKSSDFIGGFITTKVLKNLILCGMPAPKGKVETTKELKQGVGGTAPVDFISDKKTLIDLINNLNNYFVNNEIRVHPAFGKMNKKEWNRLAWIHLDHHLRQFGC